MQHAEDHREEQHAEGAHIEKLASWTVEEVGIGTRARLNQVVTIMHWL